MRKRFLTTYILPYYGKAARMDLISDTNRKEFGNLRLLRCYLIFDYSVSWVISGIVGGTEQ